MMDQSRQQGRNREAGSVTCNVQVHRIERTDKWFNVCVRGAADRSIGDCVYESSRVLADCPIARGIVSLNSVKDLVDSGCGPNGVTRGVFPFLGFLFLVPLKEVGS